MELRVTVVEGKISSVNVDAYGTDCAVVMEKFLPKKEEPKPSYIPPVPGHFFMPLNEERLDNAVRSVVSADKVSNRIPLIKMVRELTGWGLKESKDFVLKQIDQMLGSDDANWR